MEWISINKRLPKASYHDKIVVILKNGERSLMYYNGTRSDTRWKAEVGQWLDESEQSSPWLPVDGGVLPENGQLVLCYRVSNKIRMLMYTEFGKFINSEGERVYDVTAWMPLPQPPITTNNLK